MDDILVDKTEWQKLDNLIGLNRSIDTLFENFAKNRDAQDYEINRSHLPEQIKKSIENRIIEVDDIQLSFPDPKGIPEAVVEKADFFVDEGELLVIVGPSGCGKSTILRMIAGLLEPTGGRISFRDSISKEMRPQIGPTHEIGIVFQNYSCFRGSRRLGISCLGPEPRVKQPKLIGLYLRKCSK